MATLPSVVNRYWLARSLAELGRFAEGATYAAEAIRLADFTQHANTIAMAHISAGPLYLLKGDWARAHSRLDHLITVVRTGNITFLLHASLAYSAWALAQLGDASEALNRVREGAEALGAWQGARARRQRRRDVQHSGARQSAVQPT